MLEKPGPSEKEKVREATDAEREGQPAVKNTALASVCLSKDTP
jgi:hypothetical protein